MDQEPRNLREAKPQEFLTPIEREINGMFMATKIVQAKASNFWPENLVEDLEKFGYSQQEIKEFNNVGFTGVDIINLNKAVRNDPANPHKMGLRKVPLLRVMSYVRGERRDAVFPFIEPAELKVHFDDFSTIFREKTQNIDYKTPVAEVLDLSTWTHVNLIRIHPFLDGNGRTSRLLVDLIFEKNNLPYITDWGVKKDEYKDVVDRIYRENNDKLFRKFLASKLLKSIKELERDGLVGELAGRKKQVLKYIENLK